MTDRRVLDSTETAEKIRVSRSVIRNRSQPAKHPVRMTEHVPKRIVGKSGAYKGSKRRIASIEGPGIPVSRDG